jgi:hypothetical protein
MTGMWRGGAGHGALAVLATAGLGVVVLLDLGAPARVWELNLTAGVVGALVVIGLARVAGPWLRRPGLFLAVVSLALVAMAMWGPDVEGVRRWAPIGPLSVHVGFVLLPAALAAMSAASGPIQAAAAALIGAVLVLQPDAGSATAFTLSVIGLAAWRRARWIILAAGIASLSAVLAWLRPDPLEPVLFVEGVTTLALAQGPLIGIGALLALAAPSGLLAARGLWPVALYWAGAAGASLVAAFPSPILGGGVSPILGYAVTWGLLAGRSAEKRT